jgi:hypothetical protein
MIIVYLVVLLSKYLIIPAIYLISPAQTYFINLVYHPLLFHIQNNIIQIFVGVCGFLIAFISLLLLIAMYNDFKERLGIIQSIKKALSHKRLLVAWPIIYILLSYLFRSTTISYITTVEYIIPASLPASLVPILIKTRLKKQNLISIIVMGCVSAFLTWQEFTNNNYSSFPLFILILRISGNMLLYGLICVYSFKYFYD